jgi:hypothetical protein
VGWLVASWMGEWMRVGGWVGGWMSVVDMLLTCVCVCAHMYTHECTDSPNHPHLTPNHPSPSFPIPRHTHHTQTQRPARSHGDGAAGRVPPRDRRHPAGHPLQRACVRACVRASLCGNLCLSRLWTVARVCLGVCLYAIGDRLHGTNERSGGGPRSLPLPC